MTEPIKTFMAFECSIDPGYVVFVDASPQRKSDDSIIGPSLTMRGGNQVLLSPGNAVELGRLLLTQYDAVYNQMLMAYDPMACDPMADDLNPVITEGEDDGCTTADERNNAPSVFLNPEWADDGERKPEVLQARINVLNKKAFRFLQRAQELEQELQAERELNRFANSKVGDSDPNLDSEAW